jgi:hypothetical protein
LARRMPARLATFRPQAFRPDQRLVRVRSTLAASSRAWRASASPCWLMGPVRSVSPD